MSYFIKDKEGFIGLVNDLFDLCGDPEEIAGKIDDVLFDYIFQFCDGNDCADKYAGERIHALKKVRDLFLHLKTN
jgi:hypothetical protein